jgi:hypothetical protein
MGCLDKIVTLGACSDADPSLSGFTLLTAPGISTENLNDIANEDYLQGTNLAMEKKALTLTQFKNDFMGVLMGNKVVPNMQMPTYTSARYSSISNLGNYAGSRGQTIFKSPSRRGPLSKIKITEIQFYSFTTADNVTLSIYGLVGNQWCVTTYLVNVVANQINVFPVDYLIEGDYARVLIDNAVVAPGSSDIICMLGCGGAMPNDTAYVMGYDGLKEVKNQGYGMNIKFQPYCDYEKILCDMAPGYVGEAIWLKWQINIFEEQLRSNRFSALVLYDREELRDKFLPQLRADYTAKWNELVAGLWNILTTYRDGCLICKSLRWQNNV